MAKRPVFQEMSQPAPGAVPGSAPVAGALIDSRTPGARRAIRAWLIVLFIMVAAMIALGGATRLTGSGLSITEWKPVTGVLPPQGDAAWAAEFAKYQQIPQFREDNPTMDVAGFKRIYWLSLIHI